MRVLLIKYGELSTKGGNRNSFINLLYKNVCYKLSNYDVSVKKDRAKMIIKFKDEDLLDIENIISNIFGIHSYSIAMVCSSDVESINKSIVNVVRDINFKSFKVEVKRSDKSFPIKSIDYSKRLGSLVLKNKSNICVDVHNPDVLINVEIRVDGTYIYYKTYPGLGGYPVGSQPRSLLMLSGGIDSVVAGYLAMKRGIVVDAVYFEAIPHTSLDAREKVISLCRKLVKYTDSINLHIVNFTPIQEEIYKNCRGDYTITIMRRMMYRIMDGLCHKYKALAIINGESIGQVASQTLSSMNVINSVTNLPVIRPLACFDKLEIIDIARRIDTYDISILPYEDCCTVFVPKHPVINPRSDIAIREEALFDCDSLIEDAINGINTIHITDRDESEFANLL